MILTYFIKVGSWLLTKETCAAIASVITTKGYVANSSVISKVGQLLLSTLTTLKHAGAAFAARDALQKIAVHCLNPKNAADIYSLPDAWSNRLVEEISLTEKVRNSTLRRSTGYALGFLAIMRADVGNKFASSVVSTPLLQKLLKLSLPSEQRIKKSLAKLKIFENQSDNNNIFVYASDSKTNLVYVEDSEYEVSRIFHTFLKSFDKTFTYKTAINLSLGSMPCSLIKHSKDDNFGRTSCVSDKPTSW